MADLPSYDALAGTPPAALNGLLAEGADAALTATYKLAWQKDQALLSVIDRALYVAANGTPAVRATKPRWLDGLILREMRTASTRFWSRDRFLRVRLLERIGVIELPVDDTYVLAMISALGPNKAEKLRSDPDLIERALWRVFEVEGGGEVSLTNVDRLDGGEWRTTFIELISDGTISRARVLASCLDALNRDFAPYRAGWYTATYRAFQPTPEELRAGQQAMRHLLRATVPATVAFAVEQLLSVQRCGWLDAGETLDALPPATLVKAKGTALDALRLARVLKDDYQGEAAKVAQSRAGTSARPGTASCGIPAGRLRKQRCGGRLGWRPHPERASRTRPHHRSVHVGRHATGAATGSACSGRVPG